MQYLSILGKTRNYAVALLPELNSAELLKLPIINTGMLFVLDQVEFGEKLCRPYYHY